MKRIFALMLAFAMAFTVSSCGVKTVDNSDMTLEANEQVSINVYALNSVRSTISRLIVNTRLDKNLYTTSCKATMRQNVDIFPKELKLRKVEIENNTAKFHFNSIINNLDDNDRMYAGEILALCVSQYENITKIQFFDEEKPLEGIMGKAYESSLIPEKNEMNLNVSLVTLFFGDKNADGLIREKRLVYVKDLLAASVVDETFKGTRDKDNKVNVIPDNTVLISYSLVEDLLTINVSKAFISDPNTNDTLAIYSLVNALTQLNGINYVRIMVNEDTKAVLGNYSLGDVFSKKDDLILY